MEKGGLMTTMTSEKREENIGNTSLMGKEREGKERKKISPHNIIQSQNYNIFACPKSSIIVTLSLDHLIVL